MGNVGIASLISASSGLYVSQKGLQVTGQNISNVSTAGYTRQQVTIQEKKCINIGTTTMQVGTGADVDEIRQIRDQFLDASYRTEFGRYSFYEQQYNAITEIENIFSSDSDEGFGSTLSNYWSSLNELSKNPEGLETRASFVQNAVLLVSEANKISEQLYEYQTNLNTKIKETIKSINGITKEIYNLNEKISLNEMSGDHANDYRDQRNLLVDQLSGLIQISYKEKPDGKIEILAEGYPLITSSSTSIMEYAQVSPMSPLIKAVWQESKRDVINTDKVIDSLNGNDSGQLKSLMYLRGEGEANWTTNEADIENFTIPKIQKQFDTLVHDIVTMVNDIIAPQSGVGGPTGLDGSQNIEIFSRKNVDRYDSSGVYIPEDALNPKTLYTSRNIEINSKIVTDYNKICLSANGDVGDNSIVEEIISRWDEDRITLNNGELKLNYSDYYSQFITEIGTKGNESIQYAENQEVLVNQIENKRNEIAGVSIDEEMTNIMKYQHAYNASARVVTMIDGMLDTIINKM
ncbi:MAG TPA: flagellar hook-associated protein FlgK [Clostridiales bacterium]|nr:flagellar hook-associated protein FlgK [Clostridiales bacterium]